MTVFYHAPDLMEPWRPKQRIYALVVAVGDDGPVALDPETGETIAFRVVRKAGWPPYLLTDEEFGRLTSVEGKTP